MPILNDILDHQVLGPAIRQGLEQGRKEGRQEGRQEGREEGRQEGREEIRYQLMRVIEDRFGSLSAPVQARLAELSPEEWAVVLRRFSDASSVEELFPPGATTN